MRISVLGTKSRPNIARLPNFTEFSVLQILFSVHTFYIFYVSPEQGLFSNGKVAEHTFIPLPRVSWHRLYSCPLASQASTWRFFSIAINAYSPTGGIKAQHIFTNERTCIFKWCESVSPEYYHSILVLTERKDLN